MSIMLYWLVGIGSNMVIGAIVWASIDDKSKQLYRWYCKCPAEIKWFAPALILSAWPIGLWLWIKMRHKEK